MGCGLSKEENLPQPGPQRGRQPAAQGPSDAADPVRHGPGDAQQAVGLIDGIYQLVDPETLQAQQKRNERDALKQKIGPWWDQAFERGACRIPVLDIDEFEKHLERNNGILTPRGTCKADSPWCNFLHALAINPEDHIVTWKPAMGASSDMKGTALALDIRGRAFCHLVNLYRVEEPTQEVVTVNGKRQECTRCRLSFGWLTWTSTDAQHAYATFEADTIPKLNQSKHPMGSDNLPFEAGFWQSYKTACMTNINISHTQLAWPDPKTTALSERLKGLMSNILEITLAGRSDRPVMICREWLVQASNIKRRATTNGGADDAFLKVAYRKLAQHPRRCMLSDHQHRLEQSQLQASFFFDEDRFSLRIMRGSGRFRSLQTPLPLEAQEVLAVTLKTYEREAPDSWKGQLYAAKDNVLSVAMLGSVVRCRARYVQLLDFTQEDALWKVRVHL